MIRLVVALLATVIAFVIGSTNVGPEHAAVHRIPDHGDAMIYTPHGSYYALTSMRVHDRETPKGDASAQSHATDSEFDQLKYISRRGEGGFVSHSWILSNGNRAGNSEEDE